MQPRTNGPRTDARQPKHFARTELDADPRYQAWVRRTAAKFGPLTAEQRDLLANLKAELLGRSS